MALKITSENAYPFLKDTFKQIENLRASSEIMMSDGETIMAQGSQDDLVNRVVAIEASMNMMISDARVEEALELAKDLDLYPIDKRNIELMHQRWVHQASIPAGLAKEAAEARARGDQMHTEHKASGNWALMKDQYKRSFDIAREKGQIKQEKLNLSSPYEALVDEFSPGLRVTLIDQEFDKLDRALRPMIAEAAAKQAREPVPLQMCGPFDFDKQTKLNKEIAGVIGFDFNRGVHHALEVHPSMVGSRDDVRITTRLNANDVVPGLFATIHESGHAVYQQNLPAEWLYQPVGDHMGMAMHESQSMIMEYQAAMTPEFLDFLAQQIQGVFNKASDPAYAAENIRRLQTIVNPSFIRVEADEMTYPMHILLRKDLEQKIIMGEIDIGDLPEAWNEGMKARLGIVPPDASKGCMQDVHWPVGYIGYFPAYAFGAMGAAQLFKAAVNQRSEIITELGQGSTVALREWLKDNVHSNGSILSVDDLFTQATGTALNAEAYLNGLSTRYLDRPFQLN